MVIARGTVTETLQGFDKLFRENLEKEIAAIEEQLSHGGVKTWEEYRYMVGRAEGIRFCINAHMDHMQRSIDE